MLISHIYTAERYLSFTDVMRISHECSDFILESGDLPIVRYLNNTKYTNGVCKIKLRHRSTDQNIQILDAALREETRNISSKALHVAFGSSDQTSTTPFFILPPNGYRYVSYRKDSMKALEQTTSRYTQFEDIAEEVIRTTTVNISLREAILSESDLMFYNIPYYYAIKCAATPYDTFIKMSKLALSQRKN